MATVLIYYTSIGSGHQSAAGGIAQAVRALLPDVQIHLVDALPAREGRRQQTAELLSYLATSVFPVVYNWAWDNPQVAKLYRFWMNLGAGGRPTVEALYKYNPDLVVCTHSFPCDIVSSLKQKQPDWSRLPLVAVATDFQVHPYWPTKGVNAFVVPSEMAVVKLTSRGLPRQYIHHLGIPVSLAFDGTTGSPGSGPDGPLPKNVLVLAGSRKSAPYRPIWAKVEALVREVAAHPVPGEKWTVVLGNSAQLKKRLQRYIGAPNLVQYDFVTDMHRLLNEASLVVTKPGGLITAEALALGKPLLLLTNGVGQEFQNTRFLRFSGAGLVCTDPIKAVHEVRRLFDSPTDLARLQANAAMQGRGNAACDIGRLIVSMLPSRKTSNHAQESQILSE